MLVKEAKDVARQWVLAQAASRPGFCGAFTTGSVNWLAADAFLSATSDLDIMVVLDDPTPPQKLGKFRYQGVLLEVSYTGSDQFASSDQILGDYHKAPSFTTATMLADPSGWLTKLQAEVAQSYAQRGWVQARCDHAARAVLRHLGAWSEAAPLHQQVTAWYFGAGVLTHILLAAGLQNPTIRRRHVAAKELLAAYGHLDVYETLLEPLGGAHMTLEQAAQHLGALKDLFHAACSVIKTPLPFAADISLDGYPVAIEGSQELIAAGHHREALFWLVVTFCRCQQVLYHDAPAAVQERFRPAFLHLLRDLGIASPLDLKARIQQVKDLLPQVQDMAAAMMVANPAIT